MARKKILCRLADGTTATLTMKEANQIIKDKGMDPRGDVQAFHTQNVLRRMKKYMPFRSGRLYKITVIQTNIHKPEIITDSPDAQYLFRGKVMVDPKTNAAGFMTPEGWRSRKGCVKVRTSRNLQYNKNKNPRAGSRWDVAVSVNEGKAMGADATRYVKRR